MMLNFGYRLLFLISLSLVLVGCEGIECLNDENQYAEKIIYQGLNEGDANGTWACFFNRYDINIYSSDNEALKKIFENIEIAKIKTKANIKVNVYKETWIPSSTPPSNKNLLKTIAFNNKEKQ